MAPVRPGGQVMIWILALFLLWVACLYMVEEQLD